MSPKKRRKKWIAYSIWLLLCVIAVAAGGFFLKARRSNGKAPSVPSAEVKLGDFVDYVEMRGEIRVRSSTVISAPYNAGELQILKLIQNGSQVKKGEVVVQFDPSTLQRSADQARSTLKQVEAEIARAKAQQLLSDEQFLTETMSAQFSLERARLDASTRDVIPAIENEKNMLALDKAEHKLKELGSQKGIPPRRDRGRPGRNHPEAEESAGRPRAGRTQHRPHSLSRPRWMELSRCFPTRAPAQAFSAAATPIFKEGDRAYAGAAIAEIPDLSTIQANAPVTEADRGRVQLGQPVVLNIEGVPDKEHKGKVSEISPLAKLDYSGYPVTKNFDLTVRLEDPDPRLRPGMTAGFRVEVERVPGSIVIPASAIFEKGGQTVAYVLSNGVYQERRVVVARRGVGQVMVSNGLKPGERIALKDPTAEQQK